jgi:hypothetical protein
VVLTSSDQLGKVQNVLASTLASSGDDVFGIDERFSIGAAKARIVDTTPRCRR